jgi:predicted O-linked N-acetylglucosamine transferase (SPINDLY family)
MKAGEILAQAEALHRQGRVREAKALYERILAQDPDDVGALQGLGVLASQTGGLQIANRLLERAATLAPGNADIHFHRGNLFSRMDMAEQALAAYGQAIALKPDHAAANANRGVALEKLGRVEDAIEAFDRAIAAEPGFVPAHFNRGNALQKAGRFAEAVESYDRVLALKPDRADAHAIRGNLLFDLGRHDQALESFEQAARLDPKSAVAWLGCGNALFMLQRLDDANAAYDQVLTLDPNMAPAWLGRGNILYLRKNFDAAMDAYDKALALDPGLANAWEGRANVFQQRKQPDRAAEALVRIMALDPAHPFIKGALLHQKMLACDWNGVDALIRDIENDIAAGRPSAQPFGWQGVSASLQSLKRCCEIYAAALYPPRPSAPHPAPGGGKIRIGYLSGEFRDQATAQLMVGVLEQHDRAAFEIYAFDNGHDDGSEIRRRITAAVDEIIPITSLSDDEAAAAIRARDIDILVNLNGWFGDHRMGVFARRPAPIQINWLGFPGTLGAATMDYIVADKTVIAQSETQFFDEKVVWLPHCYQPNDDKKPIAEAGSPAEHGLPDSGFVFCCFNNSYKILPETFACWMRLLRATPDSVLWLIEENAAAIANLRREAAAHGVNPTRLIFAPRLPLAQHLARHRLADLFLDTMPYNAHTTASDALWAGLPLLTCRGSAFAGKVAASLLTSIGLPQLIAETPEHYEALALELAQKPDRLAALRQTLAANRLIHPLFDTQHFTRDLESAFAVMQDRRRAGLAPDHIALPG